MSPLREIGLITGVVYCAHGLLIRAYMSLADGGDDTGDGASFIFLLRMVRSIGASLLPPPPLLRFNAPVGGCDDVGLAGLFVLKSSTSDVAGGERPGDTVANNGTSYGGKLDSLLGDPLLILDGLFDSL